VYVALPELLGANLTVKTARLQRTVAKPTRLLTQVRQLQHRAKEHFIDQ